MKEVKSPDRFIWKSLTKEQAKKIFETNCIELFAIDYDYSDSLIQTNEELDEAIRLGKSIALEVGYTKFGLFGHK